MKKCLSLMLILAMIATFLVSPVSAGGIIGNMETDTQIYGLSELGVRTLVSRYFAQRKAYLQGISDTISSAVTAMVTDEAVHRETLAEADAVLADSTVVIGTVILEDYMARVEATETATFVVDGEAVQDP